MNIPNKVKIGGLKYDVLIDDTLYAKESCIGEIRHKETLIMIDNNLSDEAKGLTLIHEIIHGLLYQIANHELLNNEEFVEPFSNALYALIVDNPDLF